jgi:hypothetical protein
MAGFWFCVRWSNAFASPIAWPPASSTRARRTRRHDSASVIGTDNCVGLPVSDAAFCGDNERSLIDVDAVWNQPTPRIPALALVVFFAAVRQVKMQCAPVFLVFPDMLIDALVADKRRHPSPDGRCADWPRTGRISIATLSLSSSSRQSALCYESFAILDKVSGRTLSSRSTLSRWRDEHLKSDGIIGRTNQYFTNGRMTLSSSCLRTESLRLRANLRSLSTCLWKLPTKGSL